MTILVLDLKSMMDCKCKILTNILNLNHSKTYFEHFRLDLDDISVHIHDQFDLPDAKLIYKSYFIKSKGFISHISITKKIIESISTKKRPCQMFAKKTCTMRYIFQHFLDTYACYIVLNYDGLHLKDLKESTIGFCNVTIHEIFKEKYNDLSQQFDGLCPSRLACKQTKYYSTIRDLPSYSFKFSYKSFKLIIPKSQIYVHLSDPMVEYSMDYISYDLQSLIGEVGGTLGLTIGLSFLSISEWLFQFMKYVTSNE